MIEVFALPPDPMLVCGAVMAPYTEEVPAPLAVTEPAECGPLLSSAR